MARNINELLGKDADYLLKHQSKTVSKEQLHTPSPDFVDKIFVQTNRSTQVLRSLQALYGTGRLANTGYLSILPIDQGIEHSAGASFAKNPAYFDPENIVKLARAVGRRVFSPVAIEHRKIVLLRCVRSKGES